MKNSALSPEALYERVAGMFDNYKEVDAFWVTQDGQCFFENYENSAKSHAATHEIQCALVKRADLAEIGDAMSLASDTTQEESDEDTTQEESDEDTTQDEPVEDAAQEEPVEDTTQEESAEDTTQEKSTEDAPQEDTTQDPPNEEPVVERKMSPKRGGRRKKKS